MREDIEKLRNLVAINKMDRALQMLKEKIAAYPDLQNQLFTLSAKYNDIRQKETIGLLDETESVKMHAQVNFAVLELINEIEKGAVDSSPVQSTVATQSVITTDKKIVFISYNHNDTDTATRLKEKLKAKDIEVTIDSEKMQAGDDIKEFIEKCVSGSSTTISLVSKKSLLSAWVAMESIDTFYQEKTNTQKKFIACYIEDDFFKRNFTDDALDHIENEIAEIQTLIKNRLEKNRSIRDLQNELTRMTGLRNSMDEIIRRLRESLCIDIRNENLDTNFQKIIDAIH